jgi:uncharacterized protein (DUF2062 family)
MPVRFNHLAAMLRRTLQKWMPSPDHIRQLPGLSRFGHWLHEPGIWHLNRRSVARAFAIGLFLTMLPIPGQMPLAALAAIFFTANLPIALSLVWLTNPITMPMIFYGNYWLGAQLTGRSVIAFETIQQKGWGSTLLLDLYWPTFMGGVLLGLLLAPLGYATVSGLYHLHMRLNRLRRDQLRQQRRSNTTG